MTVKPRIRVQAVSDGMANVITALGHSSAKVGSTHYVVVDDPQGRDKAFRASTWYRKIVTIPAADAVREWRAWQAEKDQIEKIEGEENRLGVRNIVYQALLTARHTGGAVILIGGLPGSAGQELRPDSIRAGSIKYLTVLGRDEITPGEIVRDPASPYFGKPGKWTLSDYGGGSTDIHPSRVVFINGRTVPGALRKTGEVWGDSIWTQLGDSIRAADSAAGVIEALLHEAKIDVVRIKDMVSQMASGSAEADYIRRWTLTAQMKAIGNVLMLDGDDEWDQKTVTWTGLPEITRTLLTIMSGAADIPVTRLTGEQQTGLSGSDSGSLRNYYDHVRAVQELEYTPALAPLDEIVIRSALGNRPGEVWYSWRPLYTMDDKQRAEVDKLEAEAVDIYARSGLIPQDAMAEMVQNRLVESESWPGADTAYDASKMDLELPEVEEEEEEEVEQEPAPRQQQDARPMTLYIRRDVLNWEEISAHYKAQGVETTLAEKMHVTVIFTRTPMDWVKVGQDGGWGEDDGKLTIPPGGPRLMETFGEGGFVLQFASSRLSWRHMDIRQMGAEVDYSEYQPHITITWNGASTSDIEPWRGKIVLGPEIFEEVKEDWKAGVTEDGR